LPKAPRKSAYIWQALLLYLSARAYHYQQSFADGGYTSMSDKSQPMFEEKSESARQLAVCLWSVNDLLRKKKIRAKKFGRRTLVEVQSRIDYANSLPDATFAPPRRRNSQSTQPTI
jgi:hypothetical protein